MLCDLHYREVAIPKGLFEVVHANEARWGRHVDQKLLRTEQAQGWSEQAAHTLQPAPVTWISPMLTTRIYGKVGGVLCHTGR